MEVKTNIQAIEVQLANEVITTPVEIRFIDSDTVTLRVIAGNKLIDFEIVLEDTRIRLFRRKYGEGDDMARPTEETLYDFASKGGVTQ